MALNRQLGLYIVAAALLAATVGCGSNGSTGNGTTETPAAAVNEDTGKPKIGSDKLNSGQPLTPAQKGAIMSAKGHGEP